MGKYVWVILIALLSISCAAANTDRKRKPVKPNNSTEQLEVDEPLPNWAYKTFSRFKKDYKRSDQFTPSYLTDDFSGDGNEDIAIFIANRSSDQKGILYIFRKGRRAFLLGAGQASEELSEDLNWTDTWSVFKDRKTYETTFLENGDIDGSKEIFLERSAIELREDEGSGGLIYFNGEKFIWIHRGD